VNTLIVDVIYLLDHAFVVILHVVALTIVHDDHYPVFLDDDVIHLLNVFLLNYDENGSGHQISVEKRE